MIVNIEVIHKDEVVKNIAFDTKHLDPYKYIADEVEAIEDVDTLQFTTPKTSATKKVKGKSKAIDFIQYQIKNFRWM